MHASADWLTEVVNEYGQDILHFIRFYVRDNGEAEDLTQEVFIRAFRHHESLHSAQSLKTWLLRIAVNVCKDHLRKQRRRPIQYLDDLPDVEQSPSAEDDAMAFWEKQRLVLGVLGLPPKYKDVIVLHYFQGLSVRDMAITLGLSETAVKTRLHRARGRFRLEGGIDDGEQGQGY